MKDSKQKSADAKVQTRGNEEIQNRIENVKKKCYKNKEMNNRISQTKQFIYCNLSLLKKKRVNGGL